MQETPQPVPAVEPVGTPEQVKGPELLGFKVTDKVRTLSTNVFMMDENVVDLAGRSPQEIAETADRRTVGFSTEKVASGTVTVDGQTVELKSQPFAKSGTHWIDGEVMTVEEVKTKVPDSKTLVANMEGNGWTRVVKTRAGTFQPYSEGDTVIPSIPKAETK